MTDKFTIKNIFQRFRENFQSQYKVGSVQQKVMNSIADCRTAEMGTLLKFCPECWYEEVTYKSCRNRHCPTCQTYAKEKWINKRKADLINVRYFHVVFTVPSELRIITLNNKEKMYNILFRAVSETLKMLSLDEKWLGAEIGAMLILHTWTQTMLFHPHIHCLVPCGGITPNGSWRYGSKKFFIPVRVLGKIFRGKFVKYFLEEIEAGSLYLPGELSLLNYEYELKDFRIKLYKKSWYVYCKRTFNGPEAVIEYLGRYSHRVCISDHRIDNVQETTEDGSNSGCVIFSYRDNKDRGATKKLTISGVEFIRRFMWHILPKGFMKIRYIGFLSNRNKSTKLLWCQRVTGSLKRAMEFKAITDKMILEKVSGGKAGTCPACGSDKFAIVGSNTKYLANTG